MALLALAACTSSSASPTPPATSTQASSPSTTPRPTTPPPTSPGSPRAHPDIVLILTDDQRWDSLDVMDTVQSELIGHGVDFTNAFVVNPMCCPSRASILSGQWSHTTHVYKNQPPDGGFETFQAHESNTIATTLQAAGYRTALIGKYLNG